ncbi:DNA translocase FtsK 4TM domain-containing protein, partial [Methylobacterium oryzisoli]
MRSLRRSASPYDALVDSLRSFLKRRMTELTGLALVAGSAAFTISLATWSIDDPSLNHATNHGARNLLGSGGAIVSDLGMQLVGLGALALALPPAVWGVRLLRTHRLGRMPARLGLWLLGVAAASATASALPLTARWPLPTGLGGVAGDGLLGAAKSILGPAGSVASIAAAIAAVISLTAACSLSVLEDDEEEAEPYPATARYDNRPSRHNPGRAPDDDGPGLGIASLDAVAQVALRARDRVAERIETWRAARFARPEDFAEDSPVVAARRAFSENDEALWDEEAAEAPARREPVFTDERPAPATPRPQPPADEPGPRGRVAPPPAPLAARRAAPPPAAPAPGPDTYEMPSLALLAEPRGLAPSAAVSTDALEQNATLLESTLEDFGVRGEILAVRPGPVVTLYELEPAPGTKSSRVISLADDIARSMSAVSARVAVVQGRNAIGIELPNAKRETVYLRELLA